MPGLVEVQLLPTPLALQSADTDDLPCVPLANGGSALLEFVQLQLGVVDHLGDHLGEAAFDHFEVEA